MKRVVFAAALGAAVVMSTTVIAADDPIASRQAMMKNAGAAAGVLGKMAKGETDFNATSAEMAIRVLNVVSLGYGELFPEGSDTGAKNRAAPEIWTNRDGFNAEIAKLQESTAAAVESPPSSQEEVGAALGAIGQSCSSCHENFRLAQN